MVTVMVPFILAALHSTAASSPCDIGEEGNCVVTDGELELQEVAELGGTELLQRDHMSEAMQGALSSQPCQRKKVRFGNWCLNNCHNPKATCNERCGEKCMPGCVCFGGQPEAPTPQPTAEPTSEATAAQKPSACSGKKQHFQAFCDLKCNNKKKQCHKKCGEKCEQGCFCKGGQPEAPTPSPTAAPTPKPTPEPTTPPESLPCSGKKESSQWWCDNRCNTPTETCNENCAKKCAPGCLCQAT